MKGACNARLDRSLLLISRSLLLISRSFLLIKSNALMPLGPLERSL